MTQPYFWAAQTSHWTSFLFWKRRGGVAKRKCLHHVKLLCFPIHGLHVFVSIFVCWGVEVFEAIYGLDVFDGIFVCWGVLVLEAIYGLHAFYSIFVCWGVEVFEPTTIAAGHGGSTVKPSSREFDTAAEASIASSAETSSKVESSLAKPWRSTSGTEQNLKPQRWISSSVTPNQITSAIAASEKSRLRCSVVVALAAVLSHLGFPLLGSNLISSIINFRPLYLVL